MNYSALRDFQAKVTRELTGNILPFWMTKAVDLEYGGFAGQIDGYGNVIKEADKGGILNARILWTFSAAFNRLKKKGIPGHGRKEQGICQLLFL